ncbi:MAG: SRPBCC family protein [Patescibacteria group bacterium]
MRVLVCPVAIIEAPLETVLSLLELQNWSKWIDGKILDVRPPGKMIVGEEATLSAKAFLINWKVRVKVVGIDPANRSIRYDVFDPLWLKNEEDLRYKPLTATSCEVHYNCNFVFPDGIRGWLVKTLIGKRLNDVPEDSIRRLKAEAEREYKALK